MSRKSTIVSACVWLPGVLLSLPLGTGSTRGAASVVQTMNASAKSFSGSTCNTSAATASGVSEPVSCNDPIDKCVRPIKYLGSNGNCACFACEYGKATQKNVCTENLKDKQTLLAESNP